MQREKDMKIESPIFTAKNYLLLFLAPMGVVLLLLNIMLAKQNRTLKIMGAKPDRALEIQPGTALPTLEGFDRSGGKQRIDYGNDSRKTVFFVFSTRCRACKENMPNWAAVIKGLDQNRFRPAAVSLQSDGVDEYAAEFGLNQIPIITEIDPKYKVAYHFGLTPQTILVDSNGKAEKVWTGTLQGVDKENLERALDVRLP
jgi:hypothetical protein